jgi:hypothetical protein
VRTWDDNKTAINGLWPMMQLTDEEKRLWHDDLEPLDQVVLYDAIRNVKRNNDTLYPQIKWVREEYRTLHRMRQLSDRRANPSGEPRKLVRIDKKADEKMANDLRSYIDECTPGQWREAVDLIADKAAELKIELATAFRLCRYLNERLGMAQGGKVT